MSRLEDAGTTPDILSHFIFDGGIKHIDQKKDCLIRWWWKNWLCTSLPEIKIGPIFHHALNLKLMKDLNIKTETFNLFEDRITKTLKDIGKDVRKRLKQTL